MCLTKGCGIAFSVVTMVLLLLSLLLSIGSWVAVCDSAVNIDYHHCESHGIKISDWSDIKNNMPLRFLIIALEVILVAGSITLLVLRLTMPKKALLASIAGIAAGLSFLAMCFESWFASGGAYNLHYQREGHTLEHYAAGGSWAGAAFLLFVNTILMICDFGTILCKKTDNKPDDAERRQNGASAW